MKIIGTKSWEQFQRVVKRDFSCPPGTFYFRGQGSSEWPLDTTLERSGQVKTLYADYYRLISVAQPQIETFTKNTWAAAPTYPEVLKLAAEYEPFTFKQNIPAFEYMAHLRHHGFPSPLLDWSRTPYVAAFFAFRKPAKKDVAIYVYSEFPGGFKATGSGEAQILTFGPYTRTHKRHFLQQSVYTMCMDYIMGEGWRFAPHEEVFARNEEGQDALWKITIPATERVKVLKFLDAFNLNPLSLFDTEDALMETMALRGIDFKNS